MPLRNPFRKAPTGLGTTDASSAVDGGWTPRAGTDGDSEPSGRSSSSLSVASSRTEPDEYKMSGMCCCCWQDHHSFRSLAAIDLNGMI